MGGDNCDVWTGEKYKRKRTKDMRPIGIGKKGKISKAT